MKTLDHFSVIRVSKRCTISKLHNLILIFKNILKTKTIIDQPFLRKLILQTWKPQRSFLIFHIKPTLLPNPPMKRRPHIRLHRIVIKSPSSSTIHNVYFYFPATCSSNREVIPLKMSSSIGIYTHEDVILMCSYFNNCIEIGRLERSVEYCSLTWFYGWIHAFEYSRMFWFEMTVKFSKISC